MGINKSNVTWIKGLLNSEAKECERLVKSISKEDHIEWYRKGYDLQGKGKHREGYQAYLKCN